MNDNKKYAILIDSENVSPKYIEGIFSELSNYGEIPIRRIYGDFTVNNSWHNACVDYSLKTILQINNTKGKNASDSSLVIDAMDILYRDTFIDGFVIVSSDSDFTGLARRLKESSKEIIGMGEAKTPKSLVKACNIFKYLENLITDTDENANQKINATDIKELEIKIKDLILSKDGKIFVSQLKEQLTKIYPDFDEKNYGFNQMTKLLMSINDLQVELQSDGNTYCVVYGKMLENNKNLMDEQAIKFVEIRLALKKNIKLSELCQKLIDEKYDYKVFGYSNFKKYVQSIKNLKIDKDSNVSLK